MNYIIFMRRALMCSLLLAAFFICSASDVAAGPPLEPSELLADGLINPGYIATQTPSFSAVFNDADSGDSASYYRIQVSSGSDNWEDAVWDSDKTILPDVLTSGERSEEILYEGSLLPFNKAKYHWRIMFWDNGDNEGEWSAGDDYFIMASSTTEKFYSTEGDGYLYSNSDPVTGDEGWYEARNGIVLDKIKIYDSDDKSYVGSTNTYNNYAKVFKSIISFDLGLIKNKIVGASINVYVYDKENDDRDGNNFIVVTRSNPNSIMTIEVSDWFNCDSIDNPLEISGRYDIGYNINTGKYNSFVLNNSGIKWVESSTIANFTFREGHDVINEKIKEDSLKHNRIIYYNSEFIQLKPYLEVTYLLPPDEEPEEPEEPNPVIIIPGIMGSMVVNGGWQVDPILKTYDNLISAIDATEEYELGVNLFTFPYDWRKSNRETAVKLDKMISDVLVSTGRNKVDLVAHSMGGLVARQYIDSVDYDNDVDQLIFLGTPHIGSTESYLAYEGATFTGILAKMEKFVLNAEAYRNSYLSSVNYIQNEVPSVGELLPIYDYLYRQADEGWELAEYPITYPRSEFLEELNTTASLNNLFAKVRIKNIYGQDYYEDTLDYLQVEPYLMPYNIKWEHGEPVTSIKGYGDGTVPLRSLQSLNTVDESVYAGASHRGIVTDAQAEIVALLTGSPMVGEPVISPWGEIKKVLFTRVYSPVDLLLKDPDENLIGRNLNFGDDENDLARAFYTGSDVEDEFATIINPIPGWYTIYLQGQEDGIYGLGADMLTDDDMSGDEEEGKIIGVISEGDVHEFRFYYDGIGIGKMELIRNINAEDLVKDVEALCNSGEIYHKSACQLLANKFRQLAKEYGKWQTESKAQKLDALAKQVDNTVENIKKQLDRLLEQGKISDIAYEILSYNASMVANEVLTSAP